jgi:hypothetical protein
MSTTVLVRYRYAKCLSRFEVFGLAKKCRLRISVAKIFALIRRRFCTKILYLESLRDIGRHYCLPRKGMRTWVVGLNILNSQLCLQ